MVKELAYSCFLFLLVWLLLATLTGCDDLENAGKNAGATATENFEKITHEICTSKPFQDMLKVMLEAQIEADIQATLTANVETRFVSVEKKIQAQHDVIQANLSGGHFGLNNEFFNGGGIYLLGAVAVMVLGFFGFLGFAVRQWVAWKHVAGVASVSGTVPEHVLNAMGPSDAKRYRMVRKIYDPLGPRAHGDD